MRCGRPLIVGNWKMNGTRSSLVEVEAIATGAWASSAELVICPPVTLLCEVAHRLSGSSVRLGAQNCQAGDAAVMAGETPAMLLADMGVDYVIIGHSERRRFCGETDALVSAKVRSAQLAGILPIVCIGEDLVAHRSGQTFAVIEQQLCDSLADVEDLSRLCIAYEPVWAVGSGLVPHAFEAAACVSYMRAWVQKIYGQDSTKVPIIYGGSVCAGNAVGFLEIEGINGLLVGGASLRADTFLAIALAAENAQSAF